MLLRVVESSRTNLPDNECSLNLGCLCSFDWGKGIILFGFTGRS